MWCGYSHDRRPPAGTQAIVDFNFSAAPINSEPCIVSLNLENNGQVSAEWFVYVHNFFQPSLSMFDIKNFDSAWQSQLSICCLKFCVFR